MGSCVVQLVWKVGVSIPNPDKIKRCEPLYKTLYLILCSSTIICAAVQTTFRGSEDDKNLSGTKVCIHLDLFRSKTM